MKKLFIPALLLFTGSCFAQIKTINVQGGGFGGAGGTTDTSSLSYRINTKLNKSDTTNKWLQYAGINQTQDSFIVIKDAVRYAYKIPGGILGIQSYDLKDTSNGIVVVNVLKFGAVGNGVHDDGPAIQAANLWITRDTLFCHGIVYFPYTGTPYILAGRTVTTASNGKPVNNAQIYIPDISPDASRTKPCGIEWVGQVAPNFMTGAAQINYAFPKSSAGVIIQSTDSLDPSGCVIGAAYTDYPTYIGRYFNFSKFEMKNIGLVVKSTWGGRDTSNIMSGIKAGNITQFGMLNCFVKVETNHENTGTPEPVSTSVGIEMPHINNWGVSYLDEVWEYGFYTGVLANEHFTSSRYLFVGANVYGLRTGGGNHLTTIQRLFVSGNRYNITLDARAYVNITMDMEEDVSSGAWFSTVWDVYQPTVDNSSIQGRIDYHRIRTDVIGGEDNIHFLRSPNVSTRVLTDTLYKRYLDIGGNAFGGTYSIGSLDTFNVNIKAANISRFVMKPDGTIIMGGNPAGMTTPPENVNIAGSLYAATYLTSPQLRVGVDAALGSYGLQVRPTTSIAPLIAQLSNGTTVLTISAAGNINVYVQNFASNAAAIAGGLATGDIYRNGDVLQIVH